MLMLHICLVLVQEAYERSSALVRSHARELHALASALLEHETLSGEQIRTLLTHGCLEETEQNAPQSEAEHEPHAAAAVGQGRSSVAPAG